VDLVIIFFSSLVHCGLQEVARAAADGSFKKLQHLRDIIFVDKSHSSEAILPVLYHCLDPGKIPTADEAAPSPAVSVAALTLTTLCRAKKLLQVWVRTYGHVWAWFLFLDTHLANITRMGATLLKCALVLWQEERGLHLNATPGVYTIVGRVWFSLSTGTDIELVSLRSVLTHLRTLDMSNLEELLEGVGGVRSLTVLGVRHLALTEEMPLTELRLDLLHNFLIFASHVAAAADDGSSPPNSGCPDGAHTTDAHATRTQREH
jgi:hypothetical protein